MWEKVVSQLVSQSSRRPETVCLVTICWHEYDVTSLIFNLNTRMAVGSMIVQLTPIGCPIASWQDNANLFEERVGIWS